MDVLVGEFPPDGVQGKINLLPVKGLDDLAGQAQDFVRAHEAGHQGGANTPGGQIDHGIEASQHLRDFRCRHHNAGSSGGQGGPAAERSTGTITLEDELKVMMLPRDPRDDKNIIIEIRAGAGGDEAAIFAGDLYRMYRHYAESQRWKVEDLSSSQSDQGGFKEVIFMVKGKMVYSRMKFESGVHRVQRVPETESQGRVHTSTATVAVLPEAEDVEVKIDDKDHVILREDEVPGIVR